MRKRLKAFFVVLIIMLAGFSATACDLGIYDAPGLGEEGGLLDIDVKDFLKAADFYNKLLADLSFMKSNCYADATLAGAQAFTIMTTYGLADMSIPSSELTAEQLWVKADLYNCVKQINFYASNIGGDVYSTFDPSQILAYTDKAISFCQQLLNTL